MISNYNLRHRRQQVKARLQELAQRRREICAALGALGLNENQKRKKVRPENVDERTWLARERFLESMTEIEKEQQHWQAERIKIHNESDSERNKQLNKIFHEVFSQDQLIEMREEAERRVEGDEPNPISFNYGRLQEYKNKYYEYRTIAQDQLEKMIEFRIMLTGLIEKGCDQFGKAEFLKFISPLNSLIIPVEELRKAKIKALL